ncbi:MAG: hypothetical protein CFE24_08570 [Flavobacterium sp. BFFFF2]|nr:MAG: hypothetical protein CFE24_08570 [Flavobacterium sp. BFFFF2]
MSQSIKLTFLFFTLFCIGQTQSILDLTKSKKYMAETTEFIKWFRRNDTTKLVLVKESASWNEILKNNTNLVADSTVFSKKEIELIKSQLALIPFLQWNDMILKNSTIVTKQEIDQFFEQSNFDAYEDIKQKFGSGFMNFSAPIFIRNDTYCIFYNDYHFGWTCGGGSLSLYKKEHGSWTFVKSYFENQY